MLHKKFMIPNTQHCPDAVTSVVLLLCCSRDVHVMGLKRFYATALFIAHSTDNEEFVFPATTLPSSCQVFSTPDLGSNWGGANKVVACRAEPIIGYERQGNSPSQPPKPSNESWKERQRGQAHEAHACL